MSFLDDPVQREAWVRRMAEGVSKNVDTLVEFAKAAHKLKLGASGGRVTLTSKECNAVIWALHTLKDRDDKQ